MGKNSRKRKRSAAAHNVPPSQESDFSISSTIRNLENTEGRKRSLDDSTNSLRQSPDTNEEHPGPESGSADWEVAGRKRKRRGPNGEKTKYPELSCSSKVQAPVKLGELQRLILYVLSDGVAPTWIAYKHALHTRKVVMLMVPGLDKNMFDTAVELGKLAKVPELADQPSVEPGSKVSDKAEADVTKPPPAKGELRQKGFELWKEGKSKDIDYRGNPIDLRADELPPHLQPMAAVFPQYWPVKAPGDSSMNKLYSPVQTILIAPIPVSKEQAIVKEMKPQREGKTYVPVRTPVTEFIHSLDELQDAEYPIHPILCGTPKDSEAEKARREKLGQTPDAGWVDTNIPSLSSTDVPKARVESGSLLGGYNVYSLDCEMVLTDDQAFSLARVSLIDWSGNKVVDELVKPSKPILNYFTQFSGMTKAKLDPVETTLQEIQTKLLSLLTPTTILLGHSLESDLTALKLTHPLCIDTSLIYPHPRGMPLRSSLKFLSQKYLNREIQKGGLNGHDSVEDARAVLDLVKLKCEKGLLWGTSEAHGEPIFRRLARSKDRQDRVRSSAIVDYGTPERGFGKEATYHLPASNDREVLDGVIRATNGDPDGKYISGDGADFTWARLRELETFLGWRNKTGEVNPTSSLPDPPKPSDPEETRRHIASTISTIASMHAALPPCTLFIVYSGTGDPRHLIRLQALQKTYKQEFRTKKWDDLTVKWTDVEEQAIKEATRKAREGVAFLCVT